MTDREARVAKNEVASRDINEKLEAAQTENGAGQYLRLVCECGHESCDEVIGITIDEYEKVRSSPTQFAIRRDHLMNDVERIVYETDRFVVVAKRDGTPADVAIEEDPRS